MVVLRPIRKDDLDHLMALAEMAEFGLTSLPCDRSYLEERIALSERAFKTMGSALPAMGRSYLFVMEAAPGQQVIGICGLVSKVGGFSPFYAYRIKAEVKESTVLGTHQVVRSLNLEEEHDGPCEIGSLFLAPAYRKHGAGRILSLLRFLFMAEYPDLVEEEVIAEMRGVVDAQGRSPFWEAIGRHFFNLDYPRADYLSQVNREFIAELIPRDPIYIPLLPEEAQAVIGQVHEKTHPARKLLESQGFAFRDQVDIFEGGPILSCARREITTVKASRPGHVVDIRSRIDAEPYLLIKPAPDFCGSSAPLLIQGEGEVRINAETADALKVHVGDAIRYAPLYGEPK